MVIKESLLNKDYTTRCDDPDFLRLDPALLNLVPPFRFAAVEEGVYRGAYPTLRNFPFLRGLKLRTIVSLIPEEPTYDLKCFAASEGISLKFFQVNRYKGEAQLLPTDMNEVLQLLINANRHPLYIHCLDGRHNVGLVIMGLRKLQNWDVNCSHLEYQRFTRSVQDEVAFIADYSGPIVVPKDIPSWLWKGSWRDASGRPKRPHVGIRLKLPSVQATGIPTSQSNSNTGAATAGELTPERVSVSPLLAWNIFPGEGGAAHVDVQDVTPAKPLDCPPSPPARLPAYIVQLDRPPTADLRFLLLRASDEVILGAPPRGGQEVWDAFSLAGRPSTVGATTSEFSALSRATTRRGTPLHPGIPLVDADDDTCSSHLSQHAPLGGIAAGTLLSLNSADGSSSHTSSAKNSSRSHRLVQFVGAEGLTSSAAVGGGNGSHLTEANISTKKPRRRKSI